MSRLSKGLEWLIEQKVIHKPERDHRPLPEVADRTPREILVVDRKVTILYLRPHHTTNKRRSQ
jgi:hypothetical protein